MFIGYVGRTINLKKLNKSIVVEKDNENELSWAWFDFPPKKVVIMDYNKYIEMITKLGKENK